jgi:hypothetical protein
VRLADDSQVAEELQGEAAQVVSLYETFFGGDPTVSKQDVEAAASRLCSQFPAANTRQGSRENAVLGRAAATTPVPSPGFQGLSDATGQRIARALELLVLSLREAQGSDIPEWLQDIVQSADEGE